VPALVPGFPPPLLGDPVQPTAPPATNNESSSTPISLHPFLRRAGITTSSMHARAVPSTAPHPNFAGRLSAEVAGVVVTVRTTVCAADPLMLTDAGRLHVAGSLAAAGVIAQLKLIAPVNPPTGVKLIVDVFPDVAPGATLTAVPLMAKPGGIVYTAVATALREELLADAIAFSVSDVETAIALL